MKALHEAFGVRNNTPDKGSTLTVEQRSDVSRKIKKMSDKELVAYFQNKGNGSYFRGIARRQILIRKLMTADELVW